MYKYLVTLAYRLPCTPERRQEWTSYGRDYQDAIAACKARLPDHVRRSLTRIDARLFGAPTTALHSTDHDRNALKGGTL